MEKNPNYQNYCSTTLKEHAKGSYNFKWIRRINGILVSVGRPALFKTEPVNKPNSVKIDNSPILSDLYIKDGMRKLTFHQKENNIFYLKTISILKKKLINVSNFYYSKIIKYRTGNHRLPVETGRWDDIP